MTAASPGSHASDARSGVIGALGTAAPPRRAARRGPSSARRGARQAPAAVALRGARSPSIMTRATSARATTGTVRLSAASSCPALGNRSGRAQAQAAGLDHHRVHVRRDKTRFGVQLEEQDRESPWRGSGLGSVAPMELAEHDLAGRTLEA